MHTTIIGTVKELVEAMQDTDGNRETQKGNQRTIHCIQNPHIIEGSLSLGESKGVALGYALGEAEKVALVNALGEAEGEALGNALGLC